MTVPPDVCPHCGRQIIEAGGVYAIEAALDRDGMPRAAQYLEQLARGSDRDRDRVADMLIRLETFAQTGTLIVPRELNHLHGDLWEIKAGDLRLPFYYRKQERCGQVRVTHGFTKRSERTPRKEIDLGLAIVREDGNR